MAWDAVDRSIHDCVDKLNDDWKLNLLLSKAGTRTCIGVKAASLSLQASCDYSHSHGWSPKPQVYNVRTTTPARAGNADTRRVDACAATMCGGFWTAAAHAAQIAAAPQDAER